MQLQVKFWQVITVQLLFLASLVWAADSRITELTELTDGNVEAGDFVECVDVSDTTDNAAGSSRKCQMKSIESAVHAAGSATAGSWPVFGSGTVLTTAEDGALEQDADAFYLTTDGGNRGVVSVEHWVRADSSRSLPNDTNENAIFDSANDTLTLETGVYYFSGMMQVTGMSATSGNALIDILGAGTATAGTWLWTICGLDNSTTTTVADDDCAQRTTQDSAASAVAAGTGTAMRVNFRGTFEVTAGGTIIPSIDQVTASAATLAAGSYFTIKRIGSTSMTAIGQWN